MPYNVYYVNVYVHLHMLHYTHCCDTRIHLLSEPASLTATATAAAVRAPLG